MNNDIEILRKLARQYYEIAYSERNFENRKLHTAVNDLKPIRPVVLIDELPWEEMNIDNELTLLCEHSFLREIECYMRRVIYQNKYFPADMVVTPYISINKIVHSTGIGIDISENTLKNQIGSSIVSHNYEDILSTEEDLEKIKLPTLTYDEQETLNRYQLLGEIIGDILPVRISGSGVVFFTPWDDITTFRGLNNVLIDLLERPEFMHKTIEKFTEICLHCMQQNEKLNLYDNNPQNLHCTPALTNDLKNDWNITRKNVWGRGAAQVFSSVSKSMHEEFDIEYMKKTIGQCGLVYYGCCEPLDKKIDIVEKIPNLRKISITPWADVDVAAEIINTRYVLSSKPNPSSVAIKNIDEDSLKKEISRILEAVNKNNCPCDIVLKDISTCANNPQNIIKWQEIVMGMVKNQ